ncbi:MAG: transposase [Planctomycetaceae bacterium]|nr:transposase [Planctomycetaceae bacterium]
MSLPFSDALFCQAFPRECTETLQEGHCRAFEFFGGVPTRISYDNSRIAETVDRRKSLLDKNKGDVERRLAKVRKRPR